MDETPICRACGQLFEAEACDLAPFGKRLAPTICDPCAIAREALPLTVEQQKAGLPYLNRNAAPMDPRIARNAAWSEMVGSYFDGFREDLLPKVIKPHASKVLAWTMKDKGVGFTGPTHGGKSRVIHELGRKLYVSGVDVFPTSGIAFQDAVSRQVDFKAEFESYLRRAKTCSVLLLDDADKLKFTEAVEAAYYALFEERRRFQRPILVTTNLRGQEMSGSGNRMPAIVSRLRDLCEFIAVG